MAGPFPATFLAASCCAANIVDEEGVANALAEPSMDCGRDFAKGSANALANAPNDGNDPGDVMAVADATGILSSGEMGLGEVGGEEITRSWSGGILGDGVRGGGGGGGCPSDAAQASLAACSSGADSGSNSLNNSLDTAGLGSGVRSLGPAKADSSRSAGSTIVKGFTGTTSGFESSHGFGEVGISGATTGVLLGGVGVVGVSSILVCASTDVVCELDAIWTRKCRNQRARI